MSHTALDTAPHTAPARAVQRPAEQNPSFARPASARPSSAHAVPPVNRSGAPSRSARRSGSRAPARAAAVAVALVIGSLALTACGPTAPDPAPDSAAHSGGHGAPAEGTPSDASAEAGTRADSGHNDADVMFAATMIPHHRQALEMSEVVLAKEDLPPAVRDLAERIKAAQGPEIEAMDSWLEAWGAAAGDHGDHAMDGMLTGEQLQQLESADGPQAAELFLAGMIEHHRGAVEMAEQELEAGRNADALALADRVIADQTAEIEEMEGLLAELKQ